MKYISLHEITHSILLADNKSVHYYMRVLKHSVDCLRELHFDVIGSLKSKKIEVNTYGAIELPCDYVDAVRVGLPSGSEVMASGSMMRTNRLVNLDSFGNKVKYGGEDWQYGNNWGSWVYPDGRGNG
ncbi:MAG: hypothetical protein WKF70_13110, partial [Chitinophagaceae bacterium]